MGQQPVVVLQSVITEIWALNTTQVKLDCPFKTCARKKATCAKLETRMEQPTLREERCKDHQGRILNLTVRGVKSKKLAKLPLKN